MLNLKVFICALIAYFTPLGPIQLFGESVEEAPLTVYIIPIKGQITKAQLYILRRGLKDAVINDISTVVLELDTPGGDLKTTIAMMEALGNFKGDTITFVNDEAISAGAYISAATDEIYFHPKGLLGAAAVIQATGAEVSETLKEKVYSYLRARVRSLSEDHRYRGDVIRAMMDSDFVFKIGKKTIKDEGELLTLTAKEATQTYGRPPEPLLAEGIANNVTEVLQQKYGEDRTFIVKNFQVTWSEHFAKWLNKITPVLLGLGMLALFIEFKTPGFGVFGLTGIVLLLIVFASSYVAGLAGHEPLIAFLIGIILISVELLVFPGIMIAGVLGVALVFGSLLWALADIWPTKEFEITGELFIGPIIDLVLGMIVAVVGMALVGRYLLRSWLWELMVLKTTSAPRQKLMRVRKSFKKVPIGTQGVSVTDLHPSGEVELSGKRYQARVNTGAIDDGATVEVLGSDGFGLIVKEIKNS